MIRSISRHSRPSSCRLAFIRGLLRLACLLLCFNVGNSHATPPEVERLSALASGGDPVALDALIGLVRKEKDADAEFALAMLIYEGRGLVRNLDQAFRLMERAAGRGHAAAGNMLGFFYQYGIGVAADSAKALAWYEKAAESGDARAQTNLGWFHERGIGLSADPAIAAIWYRKAAEQGLAAAQFNLANLYESGSGLRRDPAIAIELFKTALSGGLTAAAFRLGRLLEEQGNLAEAAEQYVRAARALNPDAPFLAARLLLAPGNPRRDPVQGVYWLERVSERDQLAALLQLAEVYENGGDLVRDAAKSADALRRAGALGHTVSAFRYAQYLQANALPDPLPWYRRAAEKGHNEAQFRLALLLDARGKDEKSRAEAVKWFRSAAEGGNLKAALRLGMALESGRGVAASPREAIIWYAKAAAADDPEATYRLGVLYDRGEGSTEEFRRARDYFARAASLGHAGASAVLKRMVGAPVLDGILDDRFKGLR